MNIYTLTLLLVMLKLVFFSKSIKDMINLAKSYTLSQCQAIDSLYTEGLNDAPHYLGLMGNFLIQKTLIQSVKASTGIMSLIVYAGEELLTFAIDLYLGTYVCLLVSAIDGTVDVATNTTEALVGLVNSSMEAFSEELNGGLTDISDFINKIVSAASKIESLFDDGDDDSDASQIDKVNLTISSLRNFRIPSSINNKLQELSNNTPDFAEVKNTTKNLISIPFEKVRNEIDSINASSIVGDSKFLYVPSLNGSYSNTSGICGPNETRIEEIYDSFEKTLKIVTAVLISLIILAAIAAMLPSAWREYKLWKRLCAMRDQYLEVQESAKRMQEKGETLDPFDSGGQEKTYDVIGSYQQCFHRWNDRIANLVFKVYCSIPHNKITSGQKVETQWVIAYVTSERALLVLGVGSLALLTSILQFIIIAVLRNLVTRSDNVSLGDLSNSTIASSLKQDMNLWSQTTNSYIASTETDLNKQVFGWINETTVSVNTTVNKMMSDIDSTLQDLFNNTILYSPMKTVVSCIIGNKLTAIEQAMTWINEKASFSLPRINASEIQGLLANQATSANTSLSLDTAETALESVVGEIRTTLLKLLHTFYKTTMWELMIAFIIIGIWVLQLPIALVILICRRRFRPQ